MHIKAFEIGQMPAADEALYPSNYPYIEDVLGYVAIGARTSQSQEHRLLGSLVDIPCGIKNPTDGSLLVTLQGVLAAQLSHTFNYDGEVVRSSGNPLAHAILR